MRLDPCCSQGLVSTLARGMGDGGSAPAPLISALYCELDSTMARTAGLLKADLFCCAHHENELQRFLNALHDLPTLDVLHKRLVHNMGDPHASRQCLNSLVAWAESFLIRRGGTLRLIGHRCSLALRVEECNPQGRINARWRQGVYADLRDCWVITDGLHDAIAELRATLKQCASIARRSFHVSYGRLIGLLQEHNDVDRTRNALGSTCLNAVRFKTSHPGSPSVIYNWTGSRPRIFPLVVFMETGTSLKSALSAQFVCTSALWHDLRSCLGKGKNVRSFQESWDNDSSFSLHEVFPNRSGVCRVLHLADVGTPTVGLSGFCPFSETGRAERESEDQQQWNDYTALPSFADFLLHEAAY